MKFVKSPGLYISLFIGLDWIDCSLKRECETGIHWGLYRHPGHKQHTLLHWPHLRQPNKDGRVDITVQLLRLEQAAGNHVVGECLCLPQP